jgi:hypothetical protein
MRIGRDDNYVKIEGTGTGYLGVEHLAAYLEDKEYLVEVQYRGFTGSATAWITDEAARRFVKDLERIYNNIGSKAILLNHSSGTGFDPLELKIVKVDSLGHIAIFVTVRRPEYVAHLMQSLTTTVAFDLDREFLGEILREFRKEFSLS